MRILTIINKLDIGGAENLAVDLSNQFVDRGHQVDLLGLADSNSFVKNRLDNSVSYRFLTSGNIYNPFLFLRLVGIIRRYDIVHVHLFPAVYWVILASLFSKGKSKIFFTEHSVFNRRHKSRFFKVLDRTLYRFVDTIICVSEGARNSLVAHIGNEYAERIIVINNGIDIDKFKRNPDVSYNLFDDRSFVIMQISSFRPQKDQRTLIMAIAELPEAIKLVLIGDGELRKDMEDLVREKGLLERVKFLGERSDVSTLLQMSDLVVLSSNHESFGLAIVEGMAAGKPVVASDIPGLREVVGQYGLLFERGDHVALSNLIQEVYVDTRLYEDLSMKSTERAAMYSLDKVVDEHISLFEKVLA